MTNCGTCQFAQGFPAPDGDQPARPERPSGFWARLFWDDEAAWWRYSLADATYLDSVNAHENLVRCRRFPERVTKWKVDFCGEHSPISNSTEAA